MQSTLNKLPPAYTSSQKQLWDMGGEGEGVLGEKQPLGFYIPSSQGGNNLCSYNQTLLLLHMGGVKGRKKDGKKASSLGLQSFSLVAKGGQEVKRSQSILGPIGLKVPPAPGDPGAAV